MHWFLEHIDGILVAVIVIVAFWAVAQEVDESAPMNPIILDEDAAEDANNLSGKEVAGRIFDEELT